MKAVEVRNIGYNPEKIPTSAENLVLKDLVYGKIRVNAMEL